MKIPSNLFSQIVEKSLDGIWIADTNFNTTYVNQIMADMIGYSQEELLRLKFKDIMTDDDWNDLESKLNSRIEGVSEHHIVRFLRKDGSALWVRAACNPLYNDNGDYVGAVGLISDITELQKDETILQAQRNVFQRLVAGASLEDSLEELLKPVDLLVFGVYSSILLLDEQGQLWKGATINLPEEYNNLINGEKIGPNVGSCGTSAWLKELVISENIQTDPRWANYKHIAAKFNLGACWSSPIISKNGKVLGTFAMYFQNTRKPTDFEIEVVKDITAAAALCIEHVRLMDAEKLHVKKMDILAESRKLLSSTMEYEDVLRKIPDLLISHGWGTWSFISLRNPDGPFRTLSVAGPDDIKKKLMGQVMEFDLDSTIALAKAIKENKPQFGNFDAEQMLELVKDLDASNPRKKLVMTLADLRLHSYIAIPLEVRGDVIGGFLLSTNDPRRAYSVDDVEFMNEIGHSCAVAIDNSLLYRETKRSVKAREDFISIASHELRTPLTSLKMRVDLLSLLMERKKFPEEVNEVLKPIIMDLKPDLHKFARLVEILLDFSKLGSDKLHLRIESCDLSKLISEEIERLRPEFMAHKTELVASVQDKVVGECDQVRVQQIVTNLLTNALKFGNQKPVFLTVTGDNHSISITVKDQGIGMNEEDTKKIFKPFERLVSDKHFGGLGLGLFITKQIVDRHNGTISVKSIPGEGTTFFVNLPLQAKI